MTTTGPNPMSQPDPMSATGAIWCDQHRRWECKHNSKRSKLRCHALAIRGTAACVNHAGKATELAKSQGEAVTAWSALTGTAVVSTAQAVLGMLQMSWLRAHLYAQLLERQFTDAQAQSDAPPQRPLPNDDEPAPHGDGAPLVGPGVGLIGHTFGAVKDVGIYATGEAIRGLAQLEAQERDRCVRYAKVAHDMEIDKEEQRIAKEQGLLLAEAVRRILDSLLALLLALIADIASRNEADAARAWDAVGQVVSDAIRSAWPAWCGDIVPREFRAISAGAGEVHR
jgi:hypothetical protein